ncbi:MAG: hypothetical protein LUE86_13990, partial [Clostridiales bacterium]|nr:hypothetical protein [Clostridiales bacterium]
DNINAATDKKKSSENPFKTDFSTKEKTGEKGTVGKEMENWFSGTGADQLKNPLTDGKTDALKGAVNLDNRIREGEKLAGDKLTEKDGVSIAFGKDVLKSSKEGKVKSGASGRQGDEGMSFEDRIRSSMELGDRKIKISTNKMGSANEFGLHDTFDKAVVKAFTSVIEDDSGMAKGIRMVQNKSMLAGLNAASSVMVAPLVQETMRRISIDLSPDEIRVFGDIIKRNNFGYFDMDEPTLWHESLASYRKVLTKAGVLQSRDGGRTSMTIGKNVRRKGTKSERDLIKKKAKITGHMKE